MKNTIKSSKEIDALFSGSRRSAQKTLIMMCADEVADSYATGRVAYLAGKRLGVAPKRNRAKRVLREAARLEGAPWPGFRVVLIAREALLTKGVAEARQDIVKALKQLKVVLEVETNV